LTGLQDLSRATWGALPHAGAFAQKEKPWRKAAMALIATLLTERDDPAARTVFFANLNCHFAT
jgi:hypothetical protein